MINQSFKSQIVWLIINGKVEEALNALADAYKVDVPNLKVGLPKKHKIKAFGCYTSQTKTIYVQNSDILINPFVILHEFYHHIRSQSVDRIHKGTEGNADKFALEYIRIFQLGTIFGYHES